MYEVRLRYTKVYTSDSDVLAACMIFAQDLYVLQSSYNILFLTNFLDPPPIIHSYVTGFRLRTILRLGDPISVSIAGSSVPVSALDSTILLMVFVLRIRR